MPIRGDMRGPSSRLTLLKHEAPVRHLLRVSGPEWRGCRNVSYFLRRCLLFAIIVLGCAGAWLVHSSSELRWELSFSGASRRNKLVFSFRGATGACPKLDGGAERRPSQAAHGVRKSMLTRRSGAVRAVLDDILFVFFRGGPYPWD